MKKLERKWLWAANWLTVAALCSGVLWRLMEGVAEAVCLVVFLASLAAVIGIMRRHLRCPGCGKTSVPPWTMKNEVRHCPKCGVKFTFEDKPQWWEKNK